MSEFSRDGEINGKPVQYPLIVPTLTKSEVQTLLSLKDKDKVPKSIEDKAAQFARQRIDAGKDPFASTGEQQALYPEMKRAEVPKQIEPTGGMLSRAQFARSIKAKYPDYANVSDDVLASKMLEKYPEYRDKVKPLDPTFWDTHPNVKALAQGTVNTLPAIGGIAGGILTAEGGPITAGAGAAVGVGAGRGLRDLIAEHVGLEPESTPLGKSSRIALDTAIAGATPFVLNAVKNIITAPKESFADILELLAHPSKTTGTVAESLRAQTPKPILTKVNVREFDPMVEELRAKLSHPSLANNPNARKAIEAAIRSRGGVL